MTYSFQYSFIFIFIVFLYCIGNYPFLPQTNFLVFFILFSCILAKQIIILVGVLIIMGAIYIVIVSVIFNAFFETVNKGFKKEKLLARLIDKFNLMPDSKTSQNLTMCLLIAFCIYILLNYVYLLDVIKNPLNNISCLFVSFLIFHRVIVVRLESRDKEVSISNLLIFIVFPLCFILTSNVLNRMVVDELELRNLLVYRPIMTTGLPTESTIGQLKPIYKFQFGSEFMLLFPNESLVYFCTGEGEKNCTLSHHKFNKDFW